MPIQLQINIDPTGTTPRANFDPTPLAASARDQIFWTNNDSEPHWPGLKNTDGTINTTFFMPNQIAPDGDVSPIFSPSVADSLPYACSLHPDEEGVINVTS